MDFFEFSNDIPVVIYYKDNVCYATGVGTNSYRISGSHISDLIPFTVDDSKIVFSYLSAASRLAGIDTGDGSLNMINHGETFYEFIDRVVGN